MRTIKVNSLAKIDPTKYREGDVFLTDRSVAILQGGKVETLVKQSDIKKIIQNEIKKAVKKDGE